MAPIAAKADGAEEKTSSRMLLLSEGAAHAVEFLFSFIIYMPNSWCYEPSGHSVAIDTSQSLWLTAMKLLSLSETPNSSCQKNGAPLSPAAEGSPVRLLLALQMQLCPS